MLDELVAANALPVINAMTDVNHPCEVQSDLYALRERRDIRGLRFLFVGADPEIHCVSQGWTGEIGTIFVLAWKLLRRLRNVPNDHGACGIC